MTIYNPRQTVLITCTTEIETSRLTSNYDLFPSNRHMPVGRNMYAITLNKEHKAAELIKESQHFVVNFMPYAHADKIVKAGQLSGAFIDKLEQVGLHSRETVKLLDQFRIAEAVGWMECELKQVIELNESVIFIGRIIYEELEKDERRAFHVKGEEYTTTK